MNHFLLCCVAGMALAYAGLIFKIPLGLQLVLAIPLGFVIAYFSGKKEGDDESTN